MNDYPIGGQNWFLYWWDNRAGKVKMAAFNTWTGAVRSALFLVSSGRTPTRPRVVSHDTREAVRATLGPVQSVSGDKFLSASRSAVAP